MLGGVAETMSQTYVIEKLFEIHLKKLNILSVVIQKKKKLE